MKKTQATILIIDDQEEILIAGKLLLKRSFEHILTCSDPKKIIGIFNDNTIDVVLMDMNFRTGYEDGKEGIFWLKEIHRMQPKAKVILMTSYGDVQTAVEGLKLGAVDYLLKPWDNEMLVKLIKDAVKQYRKSSEEEQEAYLLPFEGTSPEIRKVYKAAHKIAQTDATVLILGENGTGKSLLARKIHKDSGRGEGPFVHVDLGALNSNLFESELFGYAKGAFTDAKQDVMGRFEHANGGTIFLDEIGNVPLHLQAKLLQVIQKKEITRLGESRVRKVDVRIIGATNADLQNAVKLGNFREDLFYRINTITLKMPGLKERASDIPEMVRYFLEVLSSKYSREIPGISSEVLFFLERYDWNGNIRELENRIERAVILADDHITMEHLGFEEGITLWNSEEAKQTLSDIEKQQIIEGLRRFSGNISKTSDYLGVSRAALYRKMEKYHITADNI